MSVCIESTEQLQALLETEVAKILLEDVAQIVHEELAKEYNERVYSYVGTGIYNRRHSLSNEENMSDSIAIDGAAINLEVESTAKPSPSLLSAPIDNNAYLADWVEDGNIANPWNNNIYPWTEPRPVFETVQKKLGRTDKITNIIKRSLASKGYIVE